MKFQKIKLKLTINSFKSQKQEINKYNKNLLFKNKIQKAYSLLSMHQLLKEEILSGYQIKLLTIIKTHIKIHKIGINNKIL